MADDVRLLDAGDGRRLDRLGPLVVDRPTGAATGARRAFGPWREADLRFEGGRGWTSPGATADPGEPWLVVVDGLTMELRPTASGGVGLYPEHAANLVWLHDAATRRRTAEGSETPGGSASRAGGRAETAGGAGPQVLNLFAHTGLATLALARAGAAVAHVDAARSAVAWARRNAELSGLEDRPVRWLVDDAMAFTEREARRGRRYDGIVLDPPSFGRARGSGSSARFALEDDLARLLAACAAVAAPDAFVLLTAHSTGIDPDDLGDAVAEAFGSDLPAVVPLRLQAESGAHLDLGWAVRLDPRDGAP